MTESERRRRSFTHTKEAALTSIPTRVTHFTDPCLYTESASTHVLRQRQLDELGLLARPLMGMLLPPRAGAARPHPLLLCTCCWHSSLSCGTFIAPSDASVNFSAGAQRPGRLGRKNTRGRTDLRPRRNALRRLSCQKHACRRRSADADTRTYGKSPKVYTLA